MISNILWEWFQKWKLQSGSVSLSGFRFWWRPTNSIKHFESSGKRTFDRFALFLGRTCLEIGVGATCLSSHCQSSALFCDGRRFWKWTSLFTLHGMWKLGWKQHRWQPELPAFSQYHPYCETNCIQRSDGGRNVYGIPVPLWSLNQEEFRCSLKTGRSCFNCPLETWLT